MATYIRATWRPLSVPKPEAERSEAELCRAALGGERVAWETLIARHDRRVFLSLLARGLTPDRARDVAQEAWMRLVDQQRRGRLSKLVLPGLAIRQAAFLAAEDSRRSVSRKPHVSIEADRVELRAGTDVGAVVLCREQLEKARQRLETMSPNAQQVFRLVYQSPGLGHAEVAARLGLSLQRVRQILCEVRRELRGAFEEER